MLPAKRIFITGASAGIGLTTTRALIARGHQVWGTSRDANRLPTLDGLHAITLDLNDPRSVRTGVERALGEAGHFDVLINNAGAGVFGPLEAFSEQEFTDQLQTLLIGPWQIIRLMLPSMRARNAGLIVNVSSLAGQFPLPFLAPYTLGKAALSALSEGLGLELAHTGIAVVDVRPGDFATRFHDDTRRIDAGWSGAYGPNLERAWAAIDRNMRRAGDPAQVSRVLVKVVERDIRRPVVVVGDAFQASIAPLLARLVERRWVQWGIRSYYGIRKS